MTKANNGGAIFHINLGDYMKKAKRQLDNTEFYTKLNVIPTAVHNDIVKRQCVTSRRINSYLNTLPNHSP